MNSVSVEQIIELLVKVYGDREWILNDDPIGELIRTILSQNTSDHNSYLAFGTLKSRFKDWEHVADASPTAIANTIRAGGLAKIKANYIKQALKEIKRLRSNLNLSFLKEYSIEDARSWLMQLPGVGMKTASCVLLFSLGMPAFPVDTHVARVARRLGLIGAKISADKAHLLLESLVHPELVYKCHVLLIEHGRKTCKSQRPLCTSCVLQGICPSYDKCVTGDKCC